MRGSHLLRCSSLPWASSVGPARLMPTRLTGWGAPQRAYSRLNSATCTAVAPRPPCSGGESTPPHRSAASLACQRRPHATSSSMDPNGGGVSPCRRNHSRASRAKASSSGRSARSTWRSSEVPEALAPGGGERRLELPLVLGREPSVGGIAPTPEEDLVPARAVGTELLVHECPLHDLVGGGDGHGRGHPDVAGAPLGGELVLGVDPRRQRGAVGPGAVPEDEAGHDLVSRLLVGHAVGGGDHHVGVQGQR